MREYHQRRPMSSGSRETAKDLLFEQRVRVYLEDRHASHVIKLPQFCAADFLVSREGEITSVVECRQRDCVSTKHETLFFGKVKYNAINDIARGFGVVAKLIVGFDDVAMMVDLTRLNYWKVGRASRGPVDYPRQTDNEEVYLIPISEMVRVIGL